MLLLFWDLERKKMKTKVKLAATSIVCAGLLACVTHTPAPSPIQFNYVLDNAGANGIVQTYDMRGKTMVQIKNIDAKSFKLIGANSQPIQFTVIGETAVLDAIYPTFQVVSARGISSVTRRYGIEGTVIGTNTTPVVGETLARSAGSAVGGDDHLRREIARIQAELVNLKALLATARGTAPAAAVGDVAVADASLPPETFVRVSFDDNSDDFTPAPHVEKLLLVKAQKAATISVRGFTDSATVNPKSTALARARAFAARNFFTKHGINASIISVGYEPAGKFIGDNKTKEGKGVNRRVEINLS